VARLRFAPAAARDLQKISWYIAAAAGMRVALEVVRQVRQFLASLADFPRMGRPRPEFGSDVRSWALERFPI
jgi:plasmid stabilization system protein ParE